MINVRLPHFSNSETYDFKCSNCNKEFEIEKDILIHYCSCGYSTEFKIIIEVKEDESQI